MYVIKKNIQDKYLKGIGDKNEKEKKRQGKC